MYVTFVYYVCCFFFKQKTAYEMRISDWSSDVCSSDLAYAASRDIGNLIGGRETGRENQLPQLLVGSVLCDRHALRHSLLQDAFTVQAGAVIRHLDDDLSAMMLGRQGHVAFRVLADSHAGFGRFNTVVDAVANQMSQRVDNAFDQALGRAHV